VNTLTNKKVIVQDLGLADYRQAWEYQEQLFSEIVATKIANRSLPETEQKLTPNYLLFCEHPHVYTLGKTGKESHLLLNEQGLQKETASFYKINRGGDITYHGPGQLVGYPVWDLENFFTDIHLYLRQLEQAVIDTCAHFGLSCGRIQGLTGVWLGHQGGQPRKICAMGVKTSRWVTMHGFALNVNTQMRYFDHIIPCGIDDKAVTSMQQELGFEPDMAQVKQIMIDKLKDNFKFIL
jgi:lipoyl(octanoyl) transferase